MTKNGTHGLIEGTNEYVTRSGTKFHLQEVNPAMLQGLTDLESRPEPPLIEVTIAHKHKQWITNYDSEGYQADLAAWQSREQFRITVLTLCLGIVGDPPKSWVKETSKYLAELAGDPRDMKYRWVMSCCHIDELGALAEAITGQTMPTQEGLGEAAAAFPDTD